MKINILIIFLIGIWTTSVGQNHSNPETDQIPLDPMVRFGKLDNGFTYYLRKHKIPENTIHFNLIVKAGNYHEEEDQVEYAHLLEHLQAKETKNFPNLRTYFHQGNRHIDAKTENASTKYFATIPANNDEALYEGLRLLRDWAQGNTWEPESIAVERAAIEGEMRTSDPYRNWKRTTTERVVLNEMSYSYNSQKSFYSMQNFNPEAFKRFYNDWHRPDLQAAIIVGDINVDSLELAIGQIFSDLTVPDKPNNAQTILDKQKPKFEGEIRFSTIIDSLSSGLNLEIIRSRPNFEFNPKTISDYRNMLLQQLYLIILDKQAKQIQQQYFPPFSGFSANYLSNALGGNLQLNATQLELNIELNDAQQLKSKFQKALMVWKQIHASFNKMDLIAAKEQLQSNYNEKRLLSSKQLAWRYHDHFIHGKSAPHPDIEVQMVTDILKDIDLKALKDYIIEHGTLSKNTDYIFFKGRETNIPSYEVIKQWINEIDTTHVEPLKPPGKTIKTIGDIVQLPSQSKMEDIEIIKNIIGISTVKLQNGIKIMFKPTESRTLLYKNKVSIQAFRPHQIPLNDRKNFLAAKVAPEVIHYSGAGPYTKFELDRFLDEKKMRIRFQTDLNNQVIYGESHAEDLDELINLIFLYIKNPRKDQEAFNSWKIQQEEKIKGKAIRGSAEFVMEKITSVWYPEVPVLEIHDLMDLSMEEVFQAGENWFSELGDFTFIVTGDFDTEQILPVIVNKLSYFSVEDNSCLNILNAFEFPLKTIEKNLEYKNIDQVYVRLFFPIKAPRDIKTLIELQLLSKALHYRIFSRLRNGSYSPMVRGEWLDIKNGVFAFRIDFDSSLGNEDKMLEYALEEFRILRNGGVEDKWLKTAIIEELKSYENRFASFGYFNFWPDFLQFKLENGEDPEQEVLMYGTILEHFINLKEINASAKKYMTEEYFQQFMGYPEGYQTLK